MKYKKYILFQIDQYYPCGGLSDISDSFYTLKEAEKYAKENPQDYSEIIDRDTWERVKAID